LWPNGHDKRPGKLGKIVAVYDYTDEHGAVLFQNARLDPKTFRQRRPDPSARGGFIWKLGDVRRVLYRLPEVVEAARRGSLILIAEGEKDADNLRRLGFTATTAPFGAGEKKWRPEYSESLRGGHVAILQDNDEKGRAHARAIKVALAGIAASACLVAPLPGIEDIAKGDVSDWIARGGTSEQLLALIELVAKEDKPLKNGHDSKEPAPAPEPDAVPEVRITEDGLSLELVDRLAAAIRYVDLWGKWLKWTGDHWENENTLAVYDHARTISREAAQWFKDRKEAPPSHLAKGKTFAAVEIIARSDRRVASLSEQWDAEQLLFNAPKGTAFVEDEPW
jgi:putative DNA primase/helicase